MANEWPEWVYTSSCLEISMSVVNCQKHYIWFHATFGFYFMKLYMWMLYMEGSKKKNARKLTIENKYKLGIPKNE